MSGAFDEDWDMDVDARAEEERQLMEEAMIEEWDREISEGSINPKAESQPLAAEQNGVVASAAPASSVVGRDLPGYPQWVTGKKQLQPPDTVSGSTSSGSSLIAAAVVKQVRCEAPAPSTPPPSKRQVRIAAGELSPRKHMPQKAVGRPEWVDGWKPVWACMPASEPRDGSVVDEIVLPVAPFPSAWTMPASPPPPVDPAKAVAFGSTSVEPTATVVVPTSAVSATVTGSKEGRRLRVKTTASVVADVGKKPDAPAAKRRSGKEVALAVTILQKADDDGIWVWPDEVTWNSMDTRARKRWAWDTCRTVWCRAQGVASRRAGATGRVIVEARSKWSGFHADTRKAVYDAWAASSRKPAYINFDDLHVGGEEASASKVRTSTLLLTYNNEKWLLPPAALKRDLQGAVEVAGKIGWVQKLFNEMNDHLSKVTSGYKDMDYALSQEICPQSFSEGVARLHFHGYLRMKYGRAWMPSLDELRFDGGLPHAAAGATQSRSRATSGWSGFFYCQAPKHGAVRSGGSVEPFTGYPVQVSWILTLVQSRKISVAQGRKLALQCVAGASRALIELSLVEKQLEQEAVEKARCDAMKTLRGSRKAWREPPPVVEWRKQYDTVLDRYKFLVLEGRSGVGKTVFARSLVPVGREVLEVNCSGESAFDLREFRFGVHGLVLFDEIVGSQVQSNRKLFQAGVTPVQLGSSSTGIYTYSVFLHAVRLVCCSNEWQRSLAELPVEQQEWLRANSIYVFVESPLWTA